jgi:hypothetical protein
LNSTDMVTVTFEGVEVELVKCEDGHGGVPLRRLCESVGVDFSGQLVRVRSAASEGAAWATMEISSMIGADQRTRRMVTLPITSIPMWAATIEPSKVKPEARPLLVAYQNKAAEVLGKAFTEAFARALGVATPPSEQTSRAELLLRFERVRRLWEATLPPTTREKRLVDQAIGMTEGLEHGLAQELGVSETKIQNWQMGIAKPNAQQVASLLRIVGKTSLNQVLLPSEQPAPTDLIGLELATLGMEHDIETDHAKRVLLEKRIDALLPAEYLTAPAKPELPSPLPAPAPKRLL